MTNPEFQDWIAFHRAAFTGFSAWLAKLPEEAPEGEPTRRDVLRSWWFVLRKCELTDCRAATEAMAAGRIEEPRGYDRHKTLIRKEADRLAADRRRRSVPRYEVHDGEPAYKCLECMDTGAIWIYHPETAAKALNRRLTPTDPIYQAVVRCECGAGERYSHWPVYRPEHFCRLSIGATGQAARDELADWCDRRRAPVPENFW